MQETTQETRTVLDELYERRREVWAEQSALRVRLHEIEGEVDRIEGNAESAEWHRLAAIAERENTPEANEAAHRQWLRVIAGHHMRRGTRPDLTDHCAREVEETIDSMLAEVRQ